MEMAPANLLSCRAVVLELITYCSKKIKRTFEMVDVPPSHIMLSPCFCVLFLFSLNILLKWLMFLHHIVCFLHAFVFSFYSHWVWLFCLHKLQITHMEMIKGIKGHGYYDELVVPIIDNKAHENQLTESFAKAVSFLLIVLPTCYIHFGNSV